MVWWQRQLPAHGQIALVGDRLYWPALRYLPVVIVLITVVPNELVLVSAVAVLGFALFAVRPVIHSWLMDLAPPDVAGSATSVLFGTQALLTAIVPPLGGLVADHYGLINVFYLLALTILIANVLVWMLPSAQRAA
ncbi:MAG: hypothetical protein CM1200mP41_09680 [Gammaproteobacteria bacterium]|nr:MAG: hypothetical protein CM1200mP41_09680 [Gammaproteobacteria bacterium]